MRKVTGLLVLLTLLFLTVAVFAQDPGDCVPGMIFRGRDGQMIDCLEEIGSDCTACTFIFEG
jgi:hypothetical protein